MNILETRRYEMLVRVRDFGASHRAAFRKVPLGGKMFAEVASAVTELGEQAASQISGRSTVREGSSSKAVARAALRDSLDATSRTARALALDTPGSARINAMAAARLSRASSFVRPWPLAPGISGE